MAITNHYPIFKSIMNSLYRPEDQLNLYLSAGYSMREIKKFAIKKSQLEMYLQINHFELFKISELKKFHRTVWSLISEKENLSQGFIKYWHKKLDLGPVKLNYYNSYLKLDRKFADEFFANINICYMCGDLDPIVCWKCKLILKKFDHDKPECTSCCNCYHESEPESESESE